MPPRGGRWRRRMLAVGKPRSCPSFAPCTEASAMYALDARRGDELELFAQSAQARGRASRRKKFARVGLEGQDTGCHAQLAGLGYDPVDQRAMAAMHAVEVADGDSASAPGGRQRAVRDYHGVVKMLIIDDIFSRPM